MPRAKLAILALCLLGLQLSACSHPEPAPKEFTLVNPRPAKAGEAGNSLEMAEHICKDEAKRKGIASVVAIFSRLRKDPTEENYIACMKARGYEVKP
jgi:hypothetical protein